MNAELSQAQNDALAAVLADVGKWDGSRIKALIALLTKYLPIILPYILPLLEPATQAEVANVDAEEVEAESLSTIDWAALIKLILQLIAILFPPTPIPTPDPGPIA